MKDNNSKKKILIIEDEPEMVDLLKMRLEPAGYEVIVAFDGQAGFEMARDCKPDLVILDLMLPKMHGYDVCRLIKNDEALASISVVILTARKRDEDKIVEEDVGADAYMTKPFDGNELMFKIRKILGEGRKNTLPK